MGDYYVVKLVDDPGRVAGTRMTRERRMKRKAYAEAQIKRRGYRVQSNMGIVYSHDGSEGIVQVHAGGKPGDGVVVSRGPMTSDECLRYMGIKRDQYRPAI